MSPAHPSDRDADASLERFRSLLRFATISHPDESENDWAEFEGFAAALPGLYPAAHAVLELETVRGHSLLYRWPGTGGGSAGSTQAGSTQAGSTLAPAVLMAHYDVVPASDEGWVHPPFAAEVVGTGTDRELWGRGTLDDKGALVAILEAVERLARAGFTPERDVYLSFGHNEETAGDAAAAVAALLESRGIRPSLVLDEGGAVVEGVFPGIAAPVAVVGVAERGITTLVLSVEQEGGHASTPPASTATARLARAIVRLDKRPFPARFSTPTIAMVRTLGAHATGIVGIAFRSVRLTRPLLTRVFTRLSRETNAMVRTTLAVTQLSGSAAANVLPERATATLNIRIAVGSSLAATIAHVRAAIDDPLVAIAEVESSEPSPVSPSTGAAWDTVAASIVSTYPDAIVTPYIQLQASDSRRFTGISDHVYRFTPFEMSADERATLHAVNERIRVATWLRGIEFYATLVRAL